RESARAVATVDHRTPDAANGVAADQRGTGVQGETARRAERRSGTEKQGSGAGPARLGREGGGACTHIQVQVRVPGEHVARIADAVELDFDSWSAVGRELGRQLECEAGGVREEYSFGRYGSAHAHQRYSRPFEDRIRDGYS